MRKLLIAAIFLMPILAHAQSGPPYLQPLGATGATIDVLGAIRADSLLLVPERDTTAWVTTTGNKYPGNMKRRITYWQGHFYVHNGIKWVEIGGTASQNFANADLTLTGNRYHNGDGHTLDIDSLGHLYLASVNSNSGHIGNISEDPEGVTLHSEGDGYSGDISTTLDYSRVTATEQSSSKALTLYTAHDIPGEYKDDEGLPINYYGNYAANYTDRSLVDKHYVDSVHTYGGSNFANTDLTFTGDRMHEAAGHSLNIINTGGFETGTILVDGYATDLQLKPSSSLLRTGNGAQNLQFATNENSADIKTSNDDLDKIIFSFPADGASTSTYTDYYGLPINYGGDYENNFTMRSLVSKQYVDNAIMVNTPSLQAVTDNGSTTTDSITLPAIIGTSNYWAIHSNGSANLTQLDIGSGDGAGVHEAIINPPSGNTFPTPPTLTLPNVSGFFATKVTVNGTPYAADQTGNIRFSVTNITGNAGTVTNGVYTTGSYSNPAWINSLAYSKLTGAPPLLSLTTTGIGAATYNNATGALNVPTPVINPGTVTSVNPANGYAVTSSVTNATTTPVLTYGVDTTKLQTRARAISDSTNIAAGFTPTARNAISLTTTGTGAATYTPTTGVLNVPTPAAAPTIASTTNLLKGSGIGNAVAATPGTDYLTPAGAAALYHKQGGDTYGAPSVQGTTDNFTDTMKVNNQWAGIWDLNKNYWAAANVNFTSGGPLMGIQYYPAGATSPTAQVLMNGAIFMQTSTAQAIRINNVATNLNLESTGDMLVGTNTDDAINKVQIAGKATVNDTFKLAKVPATAAANYDWLVRDNGVATNGYKGVVKLAPFAPMADLRDSTTGTTATQTLRANSTMIAKTSGLSTLPLPTSAAVGDAITIVVASTTGSAKVTQGANQFIISAGGVSTTVGTGGAITFSSGTTNYLRYGGGNMWVLSQPGTPSIQ